MKTIIAAVIAATAIGAAAPAAMAQPYGYGPYGHRHHHWGYGPGWGPRRAFYGRRAWCYHHPYRC